MVYELYLKAVVKNTNIRLYHTIFVVFLCDLIFCQIKNNIQEVLHGFVNYFVNPES